VKNVEVKEIKRNRPNVGYYLSSVHFFQNFLSFTHKTLNYQKPIKMDTTMLPSHDQP